jgi:hypothetical protein
VLTRLTLGKSTSARPAGQAWRSSARAGHV